MRVSGGTIIRCLRGRVSFIVYILVLYERGYDGIIEELLCAVLSVLFKCDGCVGCVDAWMYESGMYGMYTSEYSQGIARE